LAGTPEAAKLLRKQSLYLHFFQLISSLFCLVKRGFVEPYKNVPICRVNYLAQGGDQQTFYVQDFFPKMFA
jgi:hypothetical protein